MALDVDSSGHRGDMAGGGFDVEGEGCYAAAHSLRAYAELVDSFQKAYFHVFVEGIGVVGAQRPSEEGFFG